ncbi:MAG: hypothetical protein JKY54_09705 [Flavobacteriales bacterium]|nr:hypothetical protein [Flavobacteriales bacterium]
MPKLKELKEKIKGLNNISLGINDSSDFTEFYNEYWPKIKEVLEFVKDRKITRKRADKKLQAAITAGDKVFAVTSDPEQLKVALVNFTKMLDGIEEKIDKIIAVFVFLDKILREETKLDDLLEQTVDFLTKVNDVLEKLEGKIETNPA